MPVSKPTREQAKPPSKLHRINGYDANVALLGAMFKVREAQWFRGAPTHIAAELLTELERRGFYLGVADRDTDHAR